MITLVIPEELQLRMHALFDSAPLESAGVLLCRQARGLHDCKLLAEEFLPYEEADYTKRTSARLTIDPLAVNERIQRAKRDELSVVQVHTHPGCDHADFSSVDTAGEDELMPVVLKRLRGRIHGTLVLGRSSSSARFYGESQPAMYGRIISVGRTLRRLDKLSVGTDERFARSYLALGKQGQAALQDMKIAIVGLGGLGSHVAEQLSYLGVRRVVLIDPDRIEVTNLNRVVGTVPSDVGRDKVDVAATRYISVFPSATVDAVAGSIIDESVARAVVDCDLAFCCTDGHGSRAILSWLAYQYLVPIIDVGVQIDVAEEAVSAIAGRVQLVGPSMPCLHCCELLNSDRVREDFMSDEERARDVYVTGVTIAQPAVVTLNAVAASLATTMLLGVTTPLPIAARMQIFNAMSGQVRAAEATSKAGCPFCSTSATALGRGDSLVGLWRKNDRQAVVQYRLRSYHPVKRTQTQASAQAQAHLGGIGLVVADRRPKTAVLLCPCGCGSVLKINLMREMGRAWRATVDADDRLSLAPSVDLASDCRAHFIMRGNVARVIYGAPQR
jgi:molybdopterin/thiamine biosynthesis adenylyltransferase